MNDPSATAVEPNGPRGSASRAALTTGTQTEPSAPRRRGFGAAAAVVLASGLLVGSVLVAVTIGQADLSVREVWTVMTDRLGLSFLQVEALGAGRAPMTQIKASIVWEMRLPRAVVAVLVGAGLAIVGAVMQTLTRNPMADPYLLGISSGASLGAVLVIVAGLGWGTFGVSAGAFAGALAAFALVIIIGQRTGVITPVRMVLAGIAIGQLCSAFMSLVVLWVADPHATQEAEFWLSGSLAGADWPSLRLATLVVLIALAVFCWHTRLLNAFAFGEDAATALGVSVNRVRWTLLVVSALLTGVLVAVSGTIGFVGLVIPHAVRFLTGPDHRLVLPLSALLGGIFLLWVDVVARTAFDPRELPVGVVTAILGVPAFVWILRRARVRG